MKGIRRCRAERFGVSTVTTSHKQWEISRDEALRLVAEHDAARAAEEAKEAEAAARRDARSAQCAALSGMTVSHNGWQYRINRRGELEDSYGNYLRTVPADVTPAGLQAWFDAWCTEMDDSGWEGVGD